MQGSPYCRVLYCIALFDHASHFIVQYRISQHCVRLQKVEIMCAESLVMQSRVLLCDCT